MKDEETKEVETINEGSPMPTELEVMQELLVCERGAVDALEFYQKCIEAMNRQIGIINDLKGIVANGKMFSPEASEKKLEYAQAMVDYHKLIAPQPTPTADPNATVTVPQ